MEKQIELKPGKRYNGNLILAVESKPCRFDMGQQVVITFSCRDCAVPQKTNLIAASRWLAKGTLFRCTKCRRRAVQNERTTARHCEPPPTIEGITVYGHRRMPVGKKLLLFVTVDCEVCDVQFEEQFKTIRIMQVSGTIRCKDCRVKAKKQGKQIGAFSAKQAAGRPGYSPIERVKAGLTPSQLAIVERRVREYIRRNLAIHQQPESLFRIYMEAAEIVKLEEGQPSESWTAANRWDGLQLQRYQHYDSPVGAF